MKIFIAGARSIKSLDDLVVERLNSICKKRYEILVGDCRGVDTAVQKHCFSLSYDNVTVFASDGNARNNIGGWRVEAVPVEPGKKGFDFYRQKDIAMADAADYGFMIWDGRSKGTYKNISTLLEQGKRVLLYMQPDKEMRVLRSKDDIDKIRASIADAPAKLSTIDDDQMSLF